MGMYELYDGNGDRGLLVVGELIDRTFREEADAVGRTDERLMTVKDPEELLKRDALQLAAYGAKHILEIALTADSDTQTPTAGA